MKPSVATWHRVLGLQVSPSRSICSAQKNAAKPLQRRPILAPDDGSRSFLFLRLLRSSVLLFRLLQITLREQELLIQTILLEGGHVTGTIRYAPRLHGGEGVYVVASVW